MMCRFVLIGLAAAMICGVAAMGPPAQGATVVKECVYTVPEEAQVTDAFGPWAKGTRWACTCKQGDRHFVVLDGVEQKVYDAVGVLALSPDGGRLAYRARTDDGQLIVVDGVEHGPYDWCSWLEFSPDGRHFAYAAARGDDAFMVVDGVEQEAFDAVGQLHLRELGTSEPAGGWAFSPDGGRFAYAALANGKQFVVLDGTKQKPYDTISLLSLVFSPDGEHFAYRARSAGKELLVLDGEEQKPYDEVAPTVFSPDSERLAYSARAGDKWCIVLDGVEQPKYDLACGPSFSPDGKRWGYRAQRGEQGFIVLDGIELDAYDTAAGPHFSPDGKRWAYVAESGKTYFMVLDGVEHDPHESAGGRFCFSPDSRRFAYSASDAPGAAWFMVVDGKKQKEYARVESPTFSGDGKLFAYEAGVGDKHPVVLDGVDQEHMGRIRWLQPDESDPGALLWYGWQGQCYKTPVDGKTGWQPGSKLYRFTARSD